MIKRDTEEKTNLPDMSRRELLAFLSETQIDGNVPASGSIAGILKKMHHEMLAGLADATKDVLEMKGSSLIETAK